MDYYDKKTLAVAESVRKLSRVLNKIDSGDGHTSSGLNTATNLPINPSQNAWVRYFDPSSKKFYFYNLATRSTQWETPASFVSAVQPSVHDQDVLVIREVLDGIIQVVSGEKDSVSSALKANLSFVEQTSNWKQYFDSSSKRWYYHNIMTNTTQWERPSELGQGSSLPVPLPVPVTIPGPVPVSATSRPGGGSEDYRCMASFNKQSGRFCFGSLGPESTGLNYWEKMGRQEDKAGRQLQAFIDLNDLERNRQETAARAKEQQTAKGRAANYEAWKRAKAAAGQDQSGKKRKQQWLYEE